MPSPELRCLECNRQFADLTADQDVERCASCGKFVVAAPTLTLAPLVATRKPEPPVVDVVAEEDIPVVGKAAPPAPPASSSLDDLPLAQPVRPVAPPPMTNMPAWARRPDEPAKPVETVRPQQQYPARPATTTRPRDEARSNTELPSEIDVKKPKIGFALFLAFLFFVAVVAAIGVLTYAIVRGLQMKKVITEAPPAVLVAEVKDDARGMRM